MKTTQFANITNVGNYFKLVILIILLLGIPTTFLTGDKPIFLFISLSYTLLWIVSIILFCSWFHRISKNKIVLAGLEEIPLYNNNKTKKLTSPGWSVGYFFIPIAACYKPYIAMKEAWFVSNKVAYNSPSIKWDFIKNWWTIWLLSGYIGQLSIRAQLRGENYALALDILSVFFNFILVFITIVLVNKLTNIQNKAMNERQLSDSAYLQV